jgi:DNA-binding CsgD family transcriptional regulator
MVSQSLGRRLGIAAKRNVEKFTGSGRCKACQNLAQSLKRSTARPLVLSAFGGEMGRKFNFSRLIDLTYEAAVDTRAWAAAVIAIAAALGAATTSLSVIDLTDPDGKKSALVVAPRTDPVWLNRYHERWSASNVVRERGLALPAGAVYQFEDLMSRSEFENTAFYNEFFAPQHADYALFANVAKESAAVAGIGFYRPGSAGRFERGEERLLSALAPHLHRAVALNLRLARLEMQRAGAAEMLNRCDHGALLVDAKARILFANAAAETLLRRGAGLRVKDGRLSTCMAAETAALRGMIAGAKDGTRGGSLTLRRENRRSLTLLVFPFRTGPAWLAQRPAAIVFVRDPEASTLPSRDEIRMLFGLTPAQAGLAREIVQGDGVPAAAERLGISRATAHTHLLEVFQKTGTNRQAELARIILQQSFPKHDFS